jgi:hypothetical protein
MATQVHSGIGARLVSALLVAVTVIVGLPALLLAVALHRFGRMSPVSGVHAPWRWSVDDLRSWARHLADGLDSSAQLVDLFFRVALVVGWICAAILIYTVVDEVVFQMRHGMPSSHRRRLIGVGALGRKLASVLVAVLPLVVNTPPLLAGPPIARSAASIDRPVVDTLRVFQPVMPTVPFKTRAPVAAGNAGWSLVEVRRGDSVWSIAQDVADGRDVAAVAQAIVGANLGTVMNDGRRFSTPALIEPGWVLNVPASTGPEPVAEMQEPAFPIDQTYVVARGDSYWKIAEDHLDEAASAGVIATYTEQLMSMNAPGLGYLDERLIRPGDVIQLGIETVDMPDSVFVDVLPPVIAEPVAVDPAPPSAPTQVAVGFPPPMPFPPPVPSSTPEPASIQPDVVSIDEFLSGDGIPKRGLGAAMLLAGGAIAVLDARRRQQLRGAQVGATFAPPSLAAVATETLLRALSPAEQLARLDLALRCVAPGLARQHARVLAADVADDGAIRVYPDRAATVVAERWTLDVDSTAWLLPADTSIVDLAGSARDVDQPCPAIVHIGESAGGHLFVDLEAIGVLSVEASPAVAASIIRCACASLAVSPFLESSRIFTVGLGSEVQLGNPNVESHPTIAQAAVAVGETVGSIFSATSGTVTTLALRCCARGGEAWEPSLLLAVGQDDSAELAALVALAGGGGRGVGVMIDRPVPGSGAALRCRGTDFVLEPLGIRVSPTGLSAADVRAVDDLLERAEWPLLAAVEEVIEVPTIVAPTFSGRPHEIVVDTFGQVAVHSPDGTSVGFDRSKALELVVWLSHHRHHPTRTSARTALWDLAVRDATFANVVSDARRAMAKVVPPPAGQEWIGRTMSEDLPLHDLVVSDTELLAERVAASRGLDDRAAIEVLRPGVALIHGMPFQGTSYLWPDAEGITSAHILLATSAAARLAACYLAIGDVDGVFWATGQGLKVLAGHEELIALRMRAHADRGDLAGVRSEWESYERAVQADTWAAAEPSPKLVDLRRQLLAPSLAS